MRWRALFTFNKFLIRPEGRVTGPGLCRRKSGDPNQSAFLQNLIFVPHIARIILDFTVVRTNIVSFKLNCCRRVVGELSVRLPSPPKRPVRF